MLGALGVVILSGCRRRIIFGVPSMLSWDSEDLPEDLSLLALSKDRPPPEMLEESLSKLPSDMLRMSVSVSERSSWLASFFFLSCFLSSGGVRLGVRDVSGKYILGFFWKRSLRIIPNEERLRSERLSWLLVSSDTPPPTPPSMTGMLCSRLSGPLRRSCRYHCWRAAAASVLLKLPVSSGPASRHT